MLEVAGFELLPPAPLFIAFAIAGLALNLVPGADMAYVAASAARNGARGGVAASLGVAAGSLGHTLMAVIGVSALIASSPVLFDAIKWLGAAYLLYLAVQLLRSGREQAPAHPQVAGSLSAAFRGGVLVNLLNPKVALFFVAFLPQFVDPGARSHTLQLLVLGLWFNVVGTLVNCAVGISTAAASKRLRSLSWPATLARWFAAAAFTVLALRLLLSERAAPALARRAIAD